MRGLHIPNPAKKEKKKNASFDDSSTSGMSPTPITKDEADVFVGASEALAEEEAFREFLEKKGVRHPAKLELGSPRAGVNRLVSSERGLVEARAVAWWDWLVLRVRIWAIDSAFRLVWWWQRQKSFTDRDIG